MPPSPTVPPTRYGLKGDVVTMDGDLVLKKGVVYIDAGTGRIASVQPAETPRPAGFDKAPVIGTRGTIYPGLIELHNHLCYNLLTLWQVPRQWEHRDQWPNHPDYLKLVRGPAQTLGNDHGQTYLLPIVRYVECKCLMGGVTTSQGITLRGTNTELEFRGNLRNVENSGRPDLPNADARIGDLKPGEADDFLTHLNRKNRCVLLHLSEGRQANEYALNRFDRLQLSSGDGWAITSALAGIHCAALREAELDILKSNGGSMVWSPLSNLLLYGTTADVATAKAKGIVIGLGSDWSPSGSKNLLGELKVAQLFSQANGGLFTDRELVEMATTNAARILKWEQGLGQVKDGMYADLLLIRKTTGDPYARLIDATEADVGLVVIDGVPRYGRKSLMQRLVSDLEPWKVGTQHQAFHLEKVSLDATTVLDIKLKDAADLLRDGLNRLAELSTASGGGGGAEGLAPAGAVGGQLASDWPWRLDIDDDVDNAFLVSAAAAMPFKEVAVPLELDPLTVVDDPSFLSRVRNQGEHVPEYLRKGLARLYR